MPVRQPPMPVRNLGDPPYRTCLYLSAAPEESQPWFPSPRPASRPPGSSGSAHSSWDRSYKQGKRKEKKLAYSIK